MPILTQHKGYGIKQINSTIKVAHVTSPKKKEEKNYTDRFIATMMNRQKLQNVILGEMANWQSNKRKQEF